MLTIAKFIHKNMFLVFVLKINPYKFRVKDIALIVRGCVQKFWTLVGTGELF